MKGFLKRHSPALFVAFCIGIMLFVAFYNRTI